MWNGTKVQITVIELSEASSQCQVSAHWGIISRVSSDSLQNSKSPQKPAQPTAVYQHCHGPTSFCICFNQTLKKYELLCKIVNRARQIAGIVLAVSSLLFPFEFHGNIPESQCDAPGTPAGSFFHAGVRHFPRRCFQTTATVLRAPVAAPPGRARRFQRRGLHFPWREKTSLLAYQEHRRSRRCWCWTRVRVSTPACVRACVCAPATRTLSLPVARLQSCVAAAPGWKELPSP